MEPGKPSDIYYTHPTPLYNACFVSLGLLCCCILICFHPAIPSSVSAATMNPHSCFPPPLRRAKRLHRLAAPVYPPSRLSLATTSPRNAVSRTSTFTLATKPSPRQKRWRSTILSAMVRYPTGTIWNATGNSLFSSISDVSPKTTTFCW